MSVKYKLVLKKDLTKGAATDAKRYYASANVTGMIGFRHDLRCGGRPFNSQRR